MFRSRHLPLLPPSKDAHPIPDELADLPYGQLELVFGVFMSEQSDRAKTDVRSLWFDCGQVQTLFDFPKLTLPPMHPGQRVLLILLRDKRRPDKRRPIYMFNTSTDTAVNFIHDFQTPVFGSKWTKTGLGLLLALAAIPIGGLFAMMSTMPWLLFFLVLEGIAALLIFVGSPDFRYAKDLVNGRVDAILDRYRLPA